MSGSPDLKIDPAAKTGKRVFCVGGSVLFFGLYNILCFSPLP
jgi:hypothetical protein